MQPLDVTTGSTVVEAPRCRACLSQDLRIHPRSRKTGFVIHQCRSCGARALGNPPTLEDLTELHDSWDVEEFSTWMERTRDHVLVSGHTSTLNRISGMLDTDHQPSLFDVGAGPGSFLVRAREAGFAVTGNDLSPGAIAFARERNDIELMLGDLSEIEDPGEHDVVTLWCVLAHVADGDQLLRESLRALKPGGVMFMQTPRWTSMDTAGQLSLDVSRGRATRIVDRRLAAHHMVLHTEESIRRHLERIGYEVVAVEAAVRYGLTTDDYLASLAAPAWLRPRLAKMIDTFLERGWFFRNVLDVYARKPLD